MALARPPGCALPMLRIHVSFFDFLLSFSVYFVRLRTVITFALIFFPVFKFGHKLTVTAGVADVAGLAEQLVHIQPDASLSVLPV